MSQTKQFLADLSAASRRINSSGATSGAGGSTRLFIGAYSGAQYTSYVRFALDWSGVGKIRTAILSLFTDDGFGGFPSSMTNNPKTTLKRLTSAFSQHTANPNWVAGDYNAPNSTTAASVPASLSRAVNAVNDIDITALVESWAPPSVKKRDGSAGGNTANDGLALIGSNVTTEAWAGFSSHFSDSSLRPYITLTYDYGLTVPDIPTSLSPSGPVASIGAFNGTFSDIKTTDTLRFSEVEVYTAQVTQAVQIISLNGGSKVYYSDHAADSTEISNAIFNHVPDNLHLARNTNYKWRGRVTDQEGQVSSWTDLVTFSVTNTNPNAPTIAPAGQTYASLAGINFLSGVFSDPDAGDWMIAYQIELAAYASGDAHWLDDSFILWNTGKKYVASGVKTFAQPYGGQALNAGTYYWRARVWDNNQGVSDWTYATITLSADFVVEAQDVTTPPQIRPQVPYRIIIRDMLQADGVTPTAGRGPGRIVAVLEDAQAVGASILYNSPGDFHFTLPIGHPQASVIEPKQTHYAVEHWQGNGWRETFAGLMWDADATNTDIVFYGIDYLALLDYTLDERYDPSNPNKAAENGGSKYVTPGKNSIHYIIKDQLSLAVALPHSPVGFITVADGDVATMNETLVVFSTYQPTLSFIAGLIDSHRAGQGKKTRISVQRTTAGGYKFVVQDDPGATRDNLRLRYGEFIQGYRVVFFGTTWASRQNVIGRNKDGLRVFYKTVAAPGIDEAVWGHFAQASFIDGVNDENDLQRRAQQLAVHGGKLGKQMGLGLRTGVLGPRDGYDICDAFPVDINYGNVNTSHFGSGYWNCMGITWQVTAATGKEGVTLTFQPREDDTPPSNDLLTLLPISPQAEWQVGYAPPDPAVETAMKFSDQTSGQVYYRQDDGTYLTGTPGDHTTPPTPSDIIAPGAVQVSKLEDVIRPIELNMVFKFGGGTPQGSHPKVAVSIDGGATTGTLTIVDSTTQQQVWSSAFDNSGGNSKLGDGTGAFVPGGQLGYLPLVTGHIYYIYATVPDTSKSVYTTGRCTVTSQIESVGQPYRLFHARPTGFQGPDNTGQPVLIGAFETVEDTGLPTASGVQWMETPGGTIDGSNTDFTLSYMPLPAAALMVFKNGILQQQGTGLDYTLIYPGSTISFEAGNLPQTDDILLATYPY